MNWNCRNAWNRIKIWTHPVHQSIKWVISNGTFLTKHNGCESWMMKLHMNRIKSFRMDLRMFTVKFRASERSCGRGSRGSLWGGDERSILDWQTKITLTESPKNAPVSLLRNYCQQNQTKRNTFPKIWLEYLGVQISCVVFCLLQVTDFNVFERWNRSAGIVFLSLELIVVDW